MDTPCGDRLPLVVSRDEISVLLATGDELEKLAWQTLYATGLRETEFLALSSDNLKDDHLVAADRQVMIDT